MAEQSGVYSPLLSLWNNAGSASGGSGPSGSYYIVVGAENFAGMSGSELAYIYNTDGTGEVILQGGDGNRAGDNYGYGVAIGGSKIAIGAWKDDTAAAEGGAVYLYDLDGSNETVITASDTKTSSYFGSAISIADNKIAVGAYWHDVPNVAKGAVYLYDMDGSNEIRIVASDGIYNAKFGYSVAVGQNKLVVGAHGDAGTYANEGSVYVYDLDGTNELKINCTVPVSGAPNFGYSVAIGSNKIAVGSPLRDDVSYEEGAVFLYDLDGTNELKVTPPGPRAAADHFGWAVHIFGDRLYVGAPHTDTNGINSGTVYVFDLTGVHIATIVASDASATSEFGVSVSATDTKLVVGAWSEDSPVTNNGAVYVYDIDGSSYTNELKIQPSTAISGGSFGYSVAIGQ
jgi:hypothetical protein